MSHYEKAMRHWKNHSKDRFTQQCGGPVHHEESKKKVRTRYLILDNLDNVIVEDENYETVIARGKLLKNQERLWFASSNLLYGRLDLVLASEERQRSF